MGVSDGKKLFILEKNTNEMNKLEQYEKYRL